MEKILVRIINAHIRRSCIQNTGISSKRSLTVPPPTEVTKAIIRTPKGSSLSAWPQNFLTWNWFPELLSK
jgi:hypothetical protein